MLDKFKDYSEESKRLLYVAMTRAKESLCIHYRDITLHKKFIECGYNNNLRAAEGSVDYSGKSSPEGITLAEVKNDYRTKSKIVFQLGYKDIFLSYFNEGHIQDRLSELCSGDELKVNIKGCQNNDGKEILIFSKSFRAKLQKYLDKGYEFSYAKVHMVVFWYDEEKEEEVKILLPIVRLEER